MNRNSKVLVVEDEDIILTLITRHLSAKGYEVGAHSLMWTALDVLDKFDILVLDLCLPNGDGRRLLQKWTERGVEWPVVVVSGRLTCAQLEDLIQEGAWNAFPKPFEMATLERVIDRFDFVRHLLHTDKEVKRLRRWVMILIVTVAALGGSEFVLPLIRTIIGGL